ncbi:hypothetical protein P7C71_g6333, partial [Lecanoromycetidae sp. Uapishka_2]
MRSSDSDNEQTQHSYTGKARQPSAKPPTSSTERSPPVSPQTSSDDETTTRRGRVRDLANLAELQAAIRIIEQHRAGSPDGQTSEEIRQARRALGLSAPRLDSSSREDDSNSKLSPGVPLSAGARKISHSRSSTDASAFIDFPRNKFDSPIEPQFAVDNRNDEDVDEDDLPEKPSLIRKKSGELVRPALRAPSLKRRPSSMPGTPTYSKAVHFQDNSLEHVKHFLQVDRPIAVSAGSSPVESCYESDSDYPFGNDDLISRSPPFDWEIRLTNFPQDSPQRAALPIRMEKVYLSSDTKVLIGAVAVRNLAFHKRVVARFTLDYWKTTSEIVAEYNNDVRKTQANDGCDRFTFNIKLEDQANLENKTMFFCVRYNVNGQEYWDNNNSINYQVDFSKNSKPQNGKQGTPAKNSRPLNALPRSKPSGSSAPRPRSMPSFDDFAGMVSPYEFNSFPQPSAVVGDSPIRFKNKPSSNEIVPDAPGRPRNSTNQQAFGNRYDFGAALSAAMQASTPRDSAKAASEKQSSSQKPGTESPPAIKVQPSPGAGKPVISSQAKETKLPDMPKPIALTTEKPSLQSTSYSELLDKYCFFGSGKPLPTPAKPTLAQFDGASDSWAAAELAPSNGSNSVNPSPPRVRSPPCTETQSSPKTTSPRASRSSSPNVGSPMGSRAASPAAFGYPYHQTMQSGLFDQHTPTAIRG